MENGAALPQSHFDDLYTAVYQLIDDAKLSYRPVKLYKGSHGSPDPHESVTDFGSWFFANRRGLLGYACHRVQSNIGNHSVDDLSEYDFTYEPRVPTRDAFSLLVKDKCRPGETDHSYLTYLVSRVHQLGSYRGGTSGYDEEARAFACAHFRQLKIQSAIDDVMIFSGGAKGVFLAFCMSIMCARDCEELHPRGGVILAPSGYYQSLRLIPAIAGGTIHVEQDLSGAIVAGWLADTAHLTGRAIYVPLVNNMDGRVLSRDQAHSIAAAVVDHNQAHRTNPVYVLGDDVYAGSYLADGAEPTPIGAVPGISPWCVSVATPSKTFALPTGRIAFATTTNATLRQALGHYRTVLSHGRVSQISELTSAAALCLTPQQWISAWNRRYRAALRLFGTEIGRLNAELGQQVFAIEPPQGGWYMCLRIHRSLFGDQARSSLDAQAALLYYGEDDRDSGLAMLPGELFGQDCRDGWFKLRANVAVDAETITRTVTRLRDMAHAIRKDRSRVLAYALGRARRVVPHLDATLAQRRY